MIEIARSFAFKLNCGTHGGAQYESADFFASQKAQCALVEADKISEALYKFCKKEVMEAVREHIEALRGGTWERRVDPHPEAKTNAAAFERAQRSAPGPRNHAGIAAASEAKRILGMNDSEHVTEMEGKI